MKVYRRTYKARDGSMREGRTYWALYYVGGQRFHESTGAKDRRAAELIASERMRTEELRRAGIVDPFASATEKSLAKHLDDFETTIRGRGRVERYVKDRRQCLDAYVAHRKARKLKDFDLPGASEFLTSIRATGVAARTVNRYYQALKQFGIWLVKTRRSPFDPFEGIKPLNESADRRHVRRALTPEEAEALLHAARTRPLKEATEARIHAGVTDKERERLTQLGDVRALVYAIALGTGLRAGEIRRLRWCDIDDRRRVVHVPAASSKSRRDQSVPLAEVLLDQLVAAKPRTAKPTDPVIPAGMFPNTLTFHRDREAAGIEREDETSRVIDFHGLRTTFISWLATQGVHPRVAQALARHASIETTMARYTDLALLDVQGTVERLPLPGAAPKAKKRGRPVSQPRSWDRRGERRTGT